jgi:hypothetical protein
LTEEERDTVEQLGRKGHVIIKERLRNVAGADELSPKQVVAAVQARVAYRFSTADFQRAWKTLRVRPATGAADPERADERYCTYYLHQAQGLRLSPGVRREARTGVLHGRRLHEPDREACA